MAEVKAILRGVNDAGDHYGAVMFWCPGCEFLDEDGHPRGGLHMLPITGDGTKRPTWGFDGNLELPTLTPSILTRTNRPEPFVCHSFLKAGVFQFLGDCTHALAGTYVPIPDLPEWVWREKPGVG